MSHSMWQKKEFKQEEWISASKGKKKNISIHIGLDIFREFLKEFQYSSIVFVYKQQHITGSLWLISPTENERLAEGCNNG